jgi:hypothetical protein
MALVALGSTPAVTSISKMGEYATEPSSPSFPPFF